MPYPNCDVCGAPADVGVASSALAPISFAYCRRCLQLNADSVVVFQSTAWTCGNEVHDGVRAMKTFVDGHYMSWDDWYAEFGEATRERLDKQYEEYMRQEAASGRAND